MIPFLLSTFLLYLSQLGLCNVMHTFPSRVKTPRRSVPYLQAIRQPIGVPIVPSTRTCADYKSIFFSARRNIFSNEAVSIVPKSEICSMTSAPLASSNTVHCVLSLRSGLSGSGKTNGFSQDDICNSCTPTYVFRVTDFSSGSSSIVVIQIPKILEKGVLESTKVWFRNKQTKRNKVVRRAYKKLRVLGLKWGPLAQGDPWLSNHIQCINDNRYMVFVEFNGVFGDELPVFKKQTCGNVAIRPSSKMDGGCTWG